MTKFNKIAKYPMPTKDAQLVWCLVKQWKPKDYRSLYDCDSLVRCHKMCINENFALLKKLYNHFIRNESNNKSECNEKMERRITWWLDDWKYVYLILHISSNNDFNRRFKLLFAVKSFVVFYLPLYSMLVHL